MQMKPWTVTHKLYEVYLYLLLGIAKCLKICLYSEQWMSYETVIFVYTDIWCNFHILECISWRCWWHRNFVWIFNAYWYECCWSIQFTQKLFYPHFQDFLKRFEVCYSMSYSYLQDILTRLMNSGISSASIEVVSKVSEAEMGITLMNISFLLK